MQSVCSAVAAASTCIRAQATTSYVAGAVPAIFVVPRDFVAIDLHVVDGPQHTTWVKHAAQLPHARGYFGAVSASSGPDSFASIE